jgi:hypothetical protein
VSRRGIAVTVAVLAVAGVTAALLVVPLGGDGGSVPPASDEPVTYTATLEPERVLFGDTVFAELELTVNRDLVVPETVRVEPDFSPFGQLGGVQVTRQDLGETTVLTYRYMLACLDRACAVEDGEAAFEMPLSLFHWADPRFGAATESIDWPEITVVSRLSAGELADPEAGLPEDPLPAASYGVSPTLLGWGFAALAAVIALSTGALVARRVWRSAPRRQEAARPEPAGSALAQAVGVVEEALSGSDEDRRTAADALARALDAEGHAELARSARRLAWSSDPPGPTETGELAAAARRLLAEAA